MAKFNKKKFSNLDASDIGKMKAPELRELLRGARAAFRAQEQTFKKYESKVWSPALEKMQDYYERITGRPVSHASFKGTPLEDITMPDYSSQRPISKMTRNQMLGEIMHLQEFFQARTSTVPGARKVMIEQDARIFGINEKTGKPAKRMSVEERTRMWRNYIKFVGTHPNIVNLLEGGSNRVQQYFGQWVKDNKGEMSVSDIEEAFNDLMDEYMTEDWEWDDYEYEDSDVFSGTRPY